MTTTSPSYAPETSAPTAVAASRGLGIASFVIGLVSLFAGYTFVVPIVGLVLGIVALRREPASRTFAIWGIVISGLMLAVTVVAGLAAVVFGLAMLPFAFL